MKNTHIYRLFKDMHLPQFLIACCIMALLLETVLGQTAPQMRHLDEAMALFMGFAYLVSIILERHVKKDEIIIILLTVCMIILGFIGNLKFDLLHNKYLWFLDAFNMFKFIAASLGALHLFSRTKHNEYIFRYLALFVEVVIILSTVFLIIHCFTNINMSTDVRYGFRTYNFVFLRVGDFYEAYLYFLIIFFADLYVEKRRITWLFIALTMINMMATFRSRAFAYAGLFILFYIAFIVFKLEKVKLRYVVPIVVAAGITFAGQYVYYFTGDKARNLLLRYGVRIMRAAFPIGTGFGTFGTAVAKEHYSKLYLRYGFWRYYGTSMRHSNFLLDTYWPAIMAELGIFGAIFMLIVVLLLFRRTVRMCNNLYSRVCIYSCWTALFISSTVSSAFFAATKSMIMIGLVCILVPIADSAAYEVDVHEKFMAFLRNNKFINKLSVLQKAALAAAILGVMCIGLLGFKYRARIQNKLFPKEVRKGASISVNPETFIFNGGEFLPFTDDIVLENARLKDLSFRDKSVDLLRQVTGEKYYSLTDEEIEAVTGEKVINGLTKVEVMESLPDGAEAELSAFDEIMSTEDREDILETSEALDEAFTLKGEILKELLKITVATEGTGNFRDRLMYYYYTTYSGTRIQAKRKLKLQGYHLPAMMLPETLPPVTRNMVKFKPTSVREQREMYTAFANYLGIKTNNGYGEDGNEEIIYQVKWDRYSSQRMTIKFIHDTLFGISVNRKFDVRIEGPEITLNAQGVTLLKGSDFDPYGYVESVRTADGKNMMGLLTIDNPVNTNIPGFYSVVYSCGADSVINLRVRVVPEKVYNDLQDR